MNKRKNIEICGERFRMVINKEYEVRGSYRGCEDMLCRLVGNSKRCGFIEDVNGDGSGDFLFLEGIDKVVKKGIEVGLWKEKEDKLIEIDNEGWDRFYDIVVC